MTTFLPRRYRAIVLTVLFSLAVVPITAGAESQTGESATGSASSDWIIQLEPGWMQFQNTHSVAEYIGDAQHRRTGADNRTIVARFDGSTRASNAIARLNSHPAIAFIEPDTIYEYQSEFIPDDPGFEQQEWARTVNLPEAWAISSGNPDVVVAIVDSGIRGDHPDLQGKLVEGRSWVGEGSEDYDPSNTTDAIGHGTQVAGIVGAAGDNGLGIAGTSMNVALMPLRVGETDGARVSRIAVAVEYAVDNGAKVINLSLGSETHSARLEKALEYAENRDVIVVAATGNTPDKVTFPGSSPRTIAVGATTIDGAEMAEFSSRVSVTDLVAPGEGVITTSWSAVSGNHYVKVGGTSFSTPIVTGVAALIHSVDPDIDVHQVRALLQQTAQMHFAEGTAGAGYGLLDANAALRQASLPAYGATWLPADEPVASLEVQRTWLWGPYAFDLRAEPYAESENGLRLVAYFDKSRMEITDIYGDRASAWYVTNGLLVNELISGDVQVGDNQFENREPAEIPVAGDPTGNNGPTYASFSGLQDADSRTPDETIIHTLQRDGTTGEDSNYATYGVTTQEYIPETGHYIASVFWEYLNSSGTLRETGLYFEGQIFNPTFFATGFPVSGAYWAEVTVGEVEQDVLIQCFERRCLTYNPSNDPGWQVEMGNVGQHYYRWRYDLEPEGAVAQDPSAYALDNLR